MAGGREKRTAGLVREFGWLREGGIGNAGSAYASLPTHESPHLEICPACPWGPASDVHHLVKSQFAVGSVEESHGSPAGRGRPLGTPGRRSGEG